MKLHKEITKGDINKIEVLSKIATTLNIDKYKGTTESACYFHAFIDFIHKPENNNLKVAFNAIDDSQSLNILFSLSIKLALFEKQFRTEGIKDKKLIDKYNELTKEYHTLIDLIGIREEETNIQSK